MQHIQNPYSFDNIDPEDLKPDKHGRVRVKAKIMREGKLKYVTPEGQTYYGNITLDALKKAKQTAALKSITIRHPPNLLKAEDVKKYHEGISEDNAQIENIDGINWLTNTLILQTPEAVNVAKEGNFGVSAGYFRDAIPKEGNILDFDNPDINHIAIGCLNPRAEGAEIYSLDDAEAEAGRLLPAEQQNPTEEVKKMKQTLNAVEVGAFSLDEARIVYDEDKSQDAINVFDDREKKLVKHVKKLQKSMDEMEKTHEEKLGELSGENKGLKAKVEELEKEKETMISMDDLNTQVQELADVRAKADEYGVEESFTTPFDGKKLIVEKVYPDSSFDESEILGAYKTIEGDPKDTKEKIKSDQALKETKTSMDSKSVGLSKIDVNALKKRK